MQIDTKWCSEHGGVPGIDISSWQMGVIDWQKVADAGIRFVILKISEGENADWRKGYSLWSKASEIIDHGFYLGYYHYCKFNNLRSEINVINKTIGTLPDSDLGLWLDVEDPDMEEVEKGLRLLIGETSPRGIYTRANFFNNCVKDRSVVRDMKLWVSHYGVNAPVIPKTFDSWDIWQFWDKQDVDGIGVVDCNIMRQNYFDEL